jgi:hypothetical protein
MGRRRAEQADQAPSEKPHQAHGTWTAGFRRLPTQ